MWIPLPRLIESHVGQHVLIEFAACSPVQLQEVSKVRSILWSASKAAGLTVCGELFHQFQPVGVSGILLLSESHMSIHTWPERGYAAVDIFACGPARNLNDAITLMKDEFEARLLIVTVILRGSNPTVGEPRTFSSLDVHNAT